MNAERILQNILRSYCVNYPILNETGLTLGKPIALVVDSIEDGIWFSRTLSPSPILVDQTWSLNEVIDEMTTAVSEAVIWVHSSKQRITQKSQTIINSLCSAASLGQIGREDCSVATITVFESIVPEELRGNVFEIHLDKIKEKYTPRLMLKDIVPEDEVLDEILYQLNEETDPIRASSLFIKRDSGCTTAEWQLRLASVVEEILRLSNEYSKEDQIKFVVLDEIASYFNMHNIKNLSEVEVKFTSDIELENSYFIENEVLFIREKLFVKSVTRLTAQIPIEAIKHRLLQEGLLTADNGGYTTQKWLKAENGRLVRKRLMAINISGYSKLIDESYIR